MQHRLDGEHGAHQGGGGADAAAPFEMVQIVHGEPVADLAFRGLRVVPQSREGAARGLFPGAQIHQQPLAQRGAPAVHHQDLPVREFLPQIVGGDDGGLIGGGEGGGKAQIQNILPLREDRPHLLLKIPHADGGGGGGLSGTDAAVKVLEGDVPAIQPVAVGLTAHLQAQRHHHDAQFPGHLVGEIAAAVGHDDEITHVHPSPFPCGGPSAGSPSPRLPPPAAGAARRHTGCWLRLRHS